MNTNMDSELRAHIAETCIGGWSPVTGMYWEESSPWQLFSFEQDVEFEGRDFRCVIIQKVAYDPDDLTAVDVAFDVFSEAWEI